MDSVFAFFEDVSLFGIFLGASIIGVLFFVIAYVVDGIFDGLFEVNVGDSSIPIVQFIAVFIATFGGAGLIVMGLGVQGFAPTIIISLLVGAALAVLFAVAMSKLQSSSNKEYAIDTEAVIGNQVQVSWWKGDHGEVLVSLAGNLFKVPAVAEQELVNSSGRFEIVSADFSGDRPIKVTVKNI